MARPSPAIYWRRRAIALVALGVLIAVIVAARTGDGVPMLTPEQARQAELAANPVHLTIEASGDLLIHSPLWIRAQELAGGSGYDFAPMFSEIRTYVEDADLALCHVETPMTSAPPASYPIFNTPPALADGIAATGWDVCDTASNHSLDQGQEGIDQTGQALGRAGLAHTGSFPSERAQRRIVIQDVEGIRIAVLAYTTDTNGIPAPAPWSVNIADANQILTEAHRAVRAGADAVIVNLHWGGGIVPEYQAAPSEAQLSLARRLLASPDITVIVGQGPHAVQPIQQIDGKYVVFSEGNLISNQSPEALLPAASQDGLIALLEMVVNDRRARVIGVSYVPVWVRHPDYEVLPVGPALEAGEADAAALRASYERTVSVAGRGHRVEPIPAQLPG